MIDLELLLSLSPESARCSSHHVSHTSLFLHLSYTLKYNFIEGNAKQDN